MEAWPQTSDSSSPWRHGRNFWFFFFSMEAWPQTSNPLAILRKLLKTSNPTLFQTSYENFSKLLTKTSQNFQSCTLPILSQSYENFQFLHFWLRKLETSNPLANFHFLQLENLKNLHFWLRNLANFSKLFTKTSYENFSKLPILHSSNTPLLVTKTWNFQFLQLENLKNLQSYTLSTTSNPPLLDENLKLPIPPLLVTKTWNFQSSRELLIPPTRKLVKPPILHSSYNFQSSPTWTLMKSWFSATFPPKCVFWTKLGGFPQFFFFFFFFFDKMDFSSKL